MLKAKRIVVLGGSSGIGFAVAKRAALEGAEVVIASHDATRVERAVAELRTVGTATGHTVDLRAQPAIRRLFEQIGAPIAHLVYTAGEELMMGPLA